MIVQEISILPNGRRKILLDNEESFVLYRGELSKLHIAENEELSESDYNKILQEILPKRAKLRGLNLLKSRPYTEYEIRKKYEDGGYPFDAIDDAVQYLKGLHLIDDREYCRIYMTYKSASKSRKRMYNDLLQKGVSREDIEFVMEELEYQGDMQPEKELIEKLIRKRHYDRENASFEDRQKMMAYLYGKGFSSELIKEMT